MGICTSILVEKIEALEKRVQELEKKPVVAENATSEKKSFIWVARDNDGDLYAHAIKPVFENGCFESVEGSFLIYEDNFPEITSENSPQKLVLESSAISKKEAAEEGYEPTIDDCFYNREKENSEKPDLQDAFTDLRALIEKYENFLEEVELKNTAFAEIILKEIREVIE